MRTCSVSRNRSTERNGPPTGPWLAKLWTFLRLEYERKCREEQAEDGVGVEEVVRPLGGWCLLPVKVGLPANGSDAGDRFLVPIGRARLVLDYSQAGIMSQPVRRCLTKLGVPELDTDMLEASSSSSSSSSGRNQAHFNAAAALPRTLVSTLDDPRAIIRAVGAAAACGTPPPAPRLSRDECFVVLRYFAELVDSWQDDTDLHAVLRSVAIHVTVAGKTRIVLHGRLVK